MQLGHNWLNNRSKHTANSLAYMSDLEWRIKKLIDFCAIAHCWLLIPNNSDIRLIAMSVLAKSTFHIWAPSSRIVISLNIPSMQLYLEMTVSVNYKNLISIVESFFRKSPFCVLRGPFHGFMFLGLECSHAPCFHLWRMNSSNPKVNEIRPSV